MELDDESLSKDTDILQKAKDFQALNTKMKEEYDVDLSTMKVYSEDKMKINVGLMVCRLPIFVTQSDYE